MKTLVLILLVFATFQVQARSADQGVTESYQGCMQFLRLSPGKQAEVAARIKKPLSLIQWACRLQKRAGMKEVIRLNREYQDWERNRRSGSSSVEVGASPCMSTRSCMGDQQCIGGTCQSIPGGCDNGPNSCVAGETCSSGVCQ